MVEIYDEVEPIEAEWEELAIRTGELPFLRPGWFLRWWEAFGSGELLIFALRRDGHLAGVLPVRRSGSAIGSPTNWQSDFYGATAEDEAVRAELFAAVFERSPRRIDFSFLEKEGDDVASFVEASGRYRTVNEVLMRSLFVRMEGDWESYLDGLSGKLRGNVRRYRRRMEGEGEVGFEVIKRSDRLDDLLDEGFRLEATGWKGDRGTAIISSPDTLKFYRETGRWAAEHGMLSLAFLRIDGQAVAFSFGLETAECQYLLKLGQDAELSRLGIGTVLMAEMISRGFSVGLEVTEFMGGPDPYKERWANGSRELLRVRAFAPTPTGTASKVLHTHGRAIAKKALRRG